MKFFAIALSVLLSVTTTFAHAAETPPSDASIKRLLEITNIAKMTDNMLAQMDGMMHNTIQQATNGKPLTAEQEALATDMRNQTRALLKEELKWSNLEPMMLDVYRKSFSQSEVDGLIAFYESPVGKSVTAKMPVVMQNSMQLMQGRMVALMPKIRAIAEQSIAKIQKSSAPPKGK